jgi:hypothetical protein
VNGAGSVTDPRLWKRFVQWIHPNTKTHETDTPPSPQQPAEPIKTKRFHSRMTHEWMQS